MQPSIETLRECFEFDAQTGILTWKRRPRSHFCSDKGEACWNARYPGTVAGYRMANGYWLISIFKKRYLVHRIGWALHYGEWPSGILDHCNGNSDENQISNLRNATTSTNGQNSRRRITSKSGVKGVSWNSKRQKWVANVCVLGQHHHLGAFHKLEDAESAVRERREQIHGLFTNHG